MSIVTIDDEYQFIEKRFLIPSIRFIVLTYCVPSSKLYDLVISCETLSPCYERADEVRNSFKRMSSIIGRLSLDGSANASGKKGRDTQEKLFAPTVLSKELPDLMVSEFNTFAKQMGIPTIPDGFRKLLSFRKNECSFEGKKETAFALPEAVTLAVLYLSHCRRAVSKLNQPITTENERKRARERFKKTKDWLESKRLYNAVVRLVLELSQEWCIDTHKIMDFDYTREYRLPERFSCTKDIRHAISHHYISDIESFDKSEWSEEKTDRFNSQHQELAYLQYYASCICPLAEWILTGVIPDNILTEKQGLDEIDLQPYTGEAHKIGGIDYWVACKTAKTIEGYLQCMFGSVKYLLSCLKDSEGLSHMPFLEYFNSL